MKVLSKNICSAVYLLTFTLCLGSSALADSAENYVNWGKKYYVTIPDDWRQIERFNVENFLILHDKDPKGIEFDIFLCPKDAEPFYSQAYVFISADQLENSASFADSIYAGMGRNFDKLIDEMAKAGPISRMKSREPVYDKSTQTLTQVSAINAQGQDQVMTLVMKFYDYGIATFYFYTTEDKYESFKDKFKEIADSFSGKDLEKAAAGQKPKIVDVSDINTQANTPGASQPGGGSESRPILPWAIAISLAIVIFIVTRKRRRSATQP